MNKINNFSKRIGDLSSNTQWGLLEPELIEKLDIAIQQVSGDIFDKEGWNNIS